MRWFWRTTRLGTITLLGAGLAAVISPVAPVAAQSGAIIGQVTVCAVRPSAPGGVNAPSHDEVVMTMDEPTAGGLPGQDQVPPPFPGRPLATVEGILVAIQGTPLATRTESDGRFRIDGVPSGIYYTVAVGPIRGVPGALSMQPNVIIDQPGGVADAGIFSLAPNCQGTPGVQLGPEPAP